MSQQLTINNSQLTNKGFTLIELIIYVGIVSIILVSITYLVLDILGSQSKSIAYLEAEQNLRFMKEIMTRDIKSAKDITSLTADTLVLKNAPSDDITYAFVSINNKISRQVGEYPSLDINSNEVEVSGSFSNLSYGARSRNVRVHLDINYYNPDNLADYRASLSSDFSVSLRGRR